MARAPAAAREAAYAGTAAMLSIEDEAQLSVEETLADLKRAQLEDERAQAIETENYQLLQKLSKILERGHNPTKGTREWGDGVRLTSTQVPVIDHCVPPKTTTFGAAVEAGTGSNGCALLSL